MLLKKRRNIFFLRFVFVCHITALIFCLDLRTIVSTVYALFDYCSFLPITAETTVVPLSLYGHFLNIYGDFGY